MKRSELELKLRQTMLGDEDYEILVVDSDGFVFDIEEVGFTSAVSTVAIYVNCREDENDVVEESS